MIFNFYYALLYIIGLCYGDEVWDTRRRVYDNHLWEPNALTSIHVIMYAVEIDSSWEAFSGTMEIS